MCENQIFFFQPDFEDLMESFAKQALTLLELDSSEETTEPKIWSGFLLSHWNLVRHRVSFGVPTTRDLIPIDDDVVASAALL